MNYDPPTPAERVLRRYRWLRYVVVLLLLLLAVYYLVFVNQYVVAYRDDLDHFKYGRSAASRATGCRSWYSRRSRSCTGTNLGQQVTAGSECSTRPSNPSCLLACRGGSSPALSGSGSIAPFATSAPTGST